MSALHLAISILLYTTPNRINRLIPVMYRKSLFAENLAVQFHL